MLIHWSYVFLAPTHRYAMVSSVKYIRFIGNECCSITTSAKPTYQMWQWNIHNNPHRFAQLWVLATDWYSLCYTSNFPQRRWWNYSRLSSHMWAYISRAQFPACIHDCYPANHSPCREPIAENLYEDECVVNEWSQHANICELDLSYRMIYYLEIKGICLETWRIWTDWII